MQKITLIGRLGRDARLVETQKGTKFIGFPVAVNSYSKGVEKTVWYEIIHLNYNEKMVPYLKKGTSVIVVGDLEVDNEVANDGKTYLRRNVLADSVAFNSFGQGSSNSGTTQTEQQVVQKETTIKTEEMPQEEPVVIKKKEVVVHQDIEDDLPF